MKKLFILALLIGAVTYSYGQSYKGKIKTKTEYTQNFEKGGKQIPEKKFEYDEHGQLIKETDYNKEGKVKDYVVYTYKGKLKMSEVTYTASGSVKKKEVYAYNSAGDRISKSTYNSDGELVKKKIYSYEYR